MNAIEKKLYSIERRLIKRIVEFNGLKVRPIKIVSNKENYVACVKEQCVEIQRHWLKKYGHDKKQIEKLITHELIHCKLSDEGKYKNFYVVKHNADFRRLADKLGCDVDVRGCVDGTHYYNNDELSAEIDFTPRQEIGKKIPLAQVEKEQEKTYKKILGLCMKTKFKVREEMMKEINNLKTTYECLISALKGGHDHICRTHIVKIRGKGIPSLLSLKSKYERLLKEQERLPALEEEWKRVQIQIDDVYGKIDRYYHCG